MKCFRTVIDKDDRVDRLHMAVLEIFAELLFSLSILSQKKIRRKQAAL